MPLSVDSDDEYKLIMRYMNQSAFYKKAPNNGNQTLEETMAVQSIFKVLPQDHERKFCVGSYFNSRVHEQDKNFRDLHNHYMLFHGTRNANVLSILGQGL